MPSHPIKIAIFGNECQHHNEQAIARVVRCLAQRNAETYVDKPFLNFLRRNSNLPTYPLTPFTGPISPLVGGRWYVFESCW